MSDRRRVLQKAEALKGVGIKKLHAEAGHIDVEFTAPPEIIAAMVEPLIEMLGDAPNYTESKVIVGKAGEPRYTLTVGRLNGRTPHELRRAAEAEVERLRSALSSLIEMLEHTRRERDEGLLEVLDQAKVALYG